MDKKSERYIKAREAACAAFWGEQWDKYSPRSQNSRLRFVDRMITAFLETYEEKETPGPESVVLENGKYTVSLEDGKFHALRYGEEWRDLCGDNLILAMLFRIRELERKID